MSGLMDAIRHAFGFAERPAADEPAHPLIEDRLRRQAAIIKALDAQVDAQRTSATILDRHRRATDR